MLKNKVITTFVLAFLMSLALVFVKRSSTSNEEKTQIIQNEEEKGNMDYKEIRASHILLNSEAEAKEILKDIKDGKVSFEDAARLKSKCPSSTRGGDLGYFKKGVMVKEFEEAAFSGEVNSILGPIKTQFGWHLIKVSDKR